MTESIDFRDGNNFVSSLETDLKQMLDEVVDLANRQYESAPFKRLLSLKLSRERAQQYSFTSRSARLLGFRPGLVAPGGEATYLGA